MPGNERQRGRTQAMRRAGSMAGDERGGEDSTVDLITDGESADAAGVAAVSAPVERAPVASTVVASTSVASTGERNVEATSRAIDSAKVCAKKASSSVWRMVTANVPPGPSVLSSRSCTRLYTRRCSSSSDGGVTGARRSSEGRRNREILFTGAPFVTVWLYCVPASRTDCPDTPVPVPR